MLDKVIRAIDTHRMVSTGDSIYIGLSGGADSVSLLVALHELRDLYRTDLHAIHVNHQLRGEESLRDERFCVELCERLGVPLHVERIDVGAYCEEHRVSTEEGARTLRYEAFERLSDGKVATAHTLSDDCETVLYNLTRGTGSRGLMGIPPVRGNVIRPLILCTRSDVEEYLASRGYTYVTDSTNLTDDYSRNRIRHGVVPVLKEINPRFEHKVLDTIEILSEDNDYLDSIVDGVYRKGVSDDGTTLGVDLRQYHDAIQHRCVTRLLKENRIPYSRDRVLSIGRALAKDGKVNVTSDVYVVAKGGTVSVVRLPKRPKSDAPTCVDLVIGGETTIFNKTVSTALVRRPTFINRMLTYYILDYDKIQGKARLRGRNFGDRIQLRGRGFTSSVKKLINENVPNDSREDLCFIADDLGLVFMERFGVAQRVACDRNTVHYLTIEVTLKNQN